jgi:hypothetical protein
MSENELVIVPIIDDRIEEFPFLSWRTAASVRRQSEEVIPAASKKAANLRNRWSRSA